MSLGKRIQLVRLERGWEQADLVEAANGCISQQALSNLEVRDSKTSEHLFAVADALGVSARWLMTGEGDKFPPTEASIHTLFPLVSDDEWDSLDDRERGIIEAKLHSAFEDIRARRAALGKGQSQEAQTISATVHG